MGTLFTARGEKFLSEFNLGEKEAATKMFFLEKKKYLITLLSIHYKTHLSNLSCNMSLFEASELRMNEQN